MRSGKEHVLGPAKPDSLGAEIARGPGVMRRVGIGAHTETPLGVGPRQKFLEERRHHRLDGRHAARDHFAGGAVERQVFAAMNHLARGAERARRVVDFDLRASRHATLAHPARDHRGMASHPAAGGQNSLGHLHSVDVLGGGFDADQDHLAAGLAHRDRFVGAEHDFARHGARRGGQSARQHLLGRAGVEPRMEQLLELHRLDAQQRRAAIDEALLRHLDRRADRGLGRALAGAGLQHVELAALDREFEVLHVAEMPLEPRSHLQQLAKGGRKALFERGVRGAALLFADAAALGPFAAGAKAYLARCANTGDHVLALGVGQKFAVDALGAG